MARRPLVRVALALALVASVSGVQGAMPFQNDAGSGRDAPDHPDDAYALPRPGEFQGNLSSLMDEDWYRLDQAGGDPTCLRARVNGSAVGNAVLSDAVGAATVERGIDPEEGAALGLATTDPETLLLGLQPRQPDGDQLRAAIGSYAFDVTFTRAASADGDPVPNGTDAPPPAADQAPDAPSSCFVGTLEETANKARGDGYGFTAHRKEKVTLSLATDPDAPLTYVNLTDPTGDQIASVTSDDPTTVTLDQNGRYRVGVETTQLVTEYPYAVAVVDDPDDDDDDDDDEDEEDDDAPGCRPTCANLPLP